MPVGLAVAIGVVQRDDAVAVENEDPAIADREILRLVKSGGEAAPLGSVVSFESHRDPDIAVEGDEGGAAVGEEFEIGDADVAFPGIRDRQGQVVEDPGGVFGGEDGGSRFDGLGPACSGSGLREGLAFFNCDPAVVGESDAAIGGFVSRGQGKPFAVTGTGPDLDRCFVRGNFYVAKKFAPLA